MMRAAGARVDLLWLEAGHALVQGDVAAAREYLNG
jgi:predicted esterase